SRDALADRPRPRRRPAAVVPGPRAHPAHRPRPASVRRPRPARGPHLDVRRVPAAPARAGRTGAHRRLRRRPAVGRRRLPGAALGGAAPARGAAPPPGRHAAHDGRRRRGRAPAGRRRHRGAAGPDEPRWRFGARAGPRAAPAGRGRRCRSGRPAPGARIGRAPAVSLRAGAHRRRGNGAHLTLDSVLRAQMESFPDPTVRVLRTLAISGAPTPVRMLRRLGDLDGPTAVRMLDELRAARLVYTATERGDELLDFTHDRIRQVARQSTSSAAARELHEKLAEAFEDASNPLRAGSHWREAGHPDRAAVHFATAARRAAEALAFDRAIVCFTDALALGNWPEEQRREMQVGLADALANVGRGAEAAPNYLAAARTAGPAQALDLRRRGTEELIRSGHLDEGRAVADEALAAAGLAFARSPVRALIAQRAALALRGRRFKRRNAEEIAPRELARTDLCWSISSGLGLMDPVQGAHFQVRSLRLALALGEPYRVARGIAGEAAYAAAQGNGQRAQKLLAEAAAIAADLQHPHATGIVSLMSGLSAHLGGRFADAVAHLATAERIFRDRCVGTAWELNAVRHFTLECFYYLGALDRFRAEAADGLKEANDRGSVYAATTLRIGLSNA